MFTEEMQTLFGILEAKIDKHVFQTKRDPLCSWKRCFGSRTAATEDQRLVRGFFFSAKRRTNVTFVLCMGAFICFVAPLGNYNTKTRYGTEEDTWYSWRLFLRLVPVMNDTWNFH
jgi:hypothetical protein